jgi:hypothetical protein
MDDVLEPCIDTLISLLAEVDRQGPETRNISHTAAAGPLEVLGQPSTISWHRTVKDQMGPAEWCTTDLGERALPT